MKRWLVMLSVVFSVLLLQGAVCAAAEIPVFNASFELLPEGVTAAEAVGKMPYGWSTNVVIKPEAGGTMQAYLTDERAYEGQYSLKLMSTTAGAILVSSQPIPVEPGRTYALMCLIYEPSNANSKDHLQPYIEFWSEETAWWSSGDHFSAATWRAQSLGAWRGSPRLAAPWIKSKGNDEWEEVILIAEAPANATHVTIALYKPKNATVGYVDSIQFASVD